MAQWEAKIRGVFSIVDDDGDDDQFVEEYTFMWSAPDFIGAMMGIQRKLDVLNEGMKKKLESSPRSAKFLEEYGIVGIVESDHILFGDRWIDEFIERGVIDRNYIED